MEGDYNDVMGRLGKEERVTKYLRMFKGGTEYSEFKKSLEEQDWPVAFRHVHTLKGNCLNLGLKKLADAASEMCDCIRPGVAPEVDIENLVKAVDEAYEQTITLLRENIE